MENYKNKYLKQKREYLCLKNDMINLFGGDRNDGQCNYENNKLYCNIKNKYYLCERDINRFNKNRNEIYEGDANDQTDGKTYNMKLFNNPNKIKFGNNTFNCIIDEYRGLIIPYSIAIIKLKNYINILHNILTSANDKKISEKISEKDFKIFDDYPSVFDINLGNFMKDIMLTFQSYYLPLEKYYNEKKDDILYDHHMTEFKNITKDFYDILYFAVAYNISFYMPDIISRLHNYNLFKIYFFDEIETHDFFNKIKSEIKGYDILNKIYEKYKSKFEKTINETLKKLYENIKNFNNFFLFVIMDIYHENYVTDNLKDYLRNEINNYIKLIKENDKLKDYDRLKDYVERMFGSGKKCSTFYEKYNFCFVETIDARTLNDIRYNGFEDFITKLKKKIYFFQENLNSEIVQRYKLEPDHLTLMKDVLFNEDDKLSYEDDKLIDLFPKQKKEKYSSGVIPLKESNFPPINDGPPITSLLDFNESPTKSSRVIPLETKEEAEDLTEVYSESEDDDKDEDDKDKVMELQQKKFDTEELLKFSGLSEENLFEFSGLSEDDER